MRELKRILLAEDDMKDVELTLDALAEYHLANSVVVVHDGVEALDYLYRKGRFAGREGGHPAIVMLDLKMPKVSGIQVLKEMKSDEELRYIPVVVLTSSRESRDLEQCYQLGVMSYIVKPVKFTDFIEAAKSVGKYWALVSKPGEDVGHA